MSNWRKWVGVGLLLLGTVVATQYVRASVGTHTPIATAAIAPEVLMAKAGALPVTEIASYF